MKIFKKLVLTLSVIVASSCTLDLTEDPNAVQPDQALPSLLLNSMQRNLAVMFQGASSIGMQVTRLQNAGNSTYETLIRPETVNGIWTSAYANILQDANTLIKLADENGYARHAGMARIIQAYTILLLVDYFGDVPFSKAFQGSTNFNPATDSQTSLYDQAIEMLDKAKLDLRTAITTANPPGYLNPVAPAITDLYYTTSGAPDFNKWIRLANTLKLKIYLNMDNVTGINSLVTETALPAGTGGFILAQDQNFVFRYGTSTSNPEARHPRFTANYLAGGGNYMSNWLIWHMYHAYDATSAGTTVGQGDPRMRFYFYRQTSSNSSSSNEIRCLTESLPSHYPSSTGSAIVDNSVSGRPPMGVGLNHPTNDPADPAWQRTFCYPTDAGYWGRDHVDPQGIPPDNFLRTAWGAYPSGGRFDANVNTGVGSTVGMRGAGIQPIMMRSYVQFMLAEAAVRLSAATPSTAVLHFENGIRNSMADVRDWAINGTYGTTGVTASPNEATAINAFYPLNYLGTFTTDVRVATTAALSSLSGNKIVDDILLADGDRILVKNQQTQSANGIYVVNSGAWTRATDSDSGPELLNQAVTVTEGTINGKKKWRQITAGTITVGTTSIVWAANPSYTDDVNNYVTAAVAAFNAVGMNYVAREYWIALFGNGVEAYNLYRRTGMPTGMQPVINPQPGTFPRSFWYPANAANLNSSITQKSDQSGKVFWDKNSSNLNF